MARTAEASLTSNWHNYLKGGLLLNYYYGLVAFLIPLGIRAIPEILAGQYPIGFDTIGFYVPNTLDWANGRTNWAIVMGSPPLMYAITVPTYAILRISPVWIFKIMGPALYGCMSWSLFRFLRVGLGFPPKHSLGTTLLTASYFVTLRIGWDLYRNMLGLTFILLSLPLLRELASRRS